MGDILYDLGLRTTGDASTRREIREAAAGPPDDVDPAALQRLLETGYGVADIATMCGVSRNAVHYWIDRDGLDTSSLPAKGSRLRIWDDEMNRFRGVTREEARRHYRRARHSNRRAAQLEVWAAEREEHVRALRRLHEELGVWPSLTELADVLETDRKSLLRRWREVAEEETWAAAGDRLFQAAGAPPEARGYTGWSPSRRQRMRPETLETPGRRIRARRLGRGWTSEDAARKADLSASYWRQIERDEAEPSREALGRIAQVLGVKRRWLVTGTTVSPKQG